jgi:hypothetical protein
MFQFDQFAHAAMLKARDLHRLNCCRVIQAQITQAIAIDEERSNEQQPLVVWRKEDVVDAVERYVLPLDPLLQQQPVEQLTVKPTCLPLIQGDVTYRIAIFHDYPGMCGIDPIHIAAPGILA